MARGIPGRPAPEPRSHIVVIAAGRIGHRSEAVEDVALSKAGDIRRSDHPHGGTAFDQELLVPLQESDLLRSQGNAQIWEHSPTLMFHVKHALGPMWASYKARSGQLRSEREDHDVASRLFAPGHGLDAVDF